MARFRNRIHYLVSPCDFAHQVIQAHPTQPRNLGLTMDFDAVTCEDCQQRIDRLGLRPRAEFPDVPGVCVVRRWPTGREEELVHMCRVCGLVNHYPASLVGQEVPCQCECFTSEILHEIKEQQPYRISLQPNRDGEYSLVKR